jgi:glutathione peroxidase
MKLFFSMIIMSGLLFASDFYSIKEKSSKGKELSFDKYKGKVVVITNIATRCGYTPQLDDLEKLNKKFQNENFVLLGVPSNDFGGQTPESSEKAAEFCRLNYGVTFPILKKQVVSGSERSQLFKFLQSQIGEDFNVKWNFEKFVIGKDGKLKGNFRSSVKPLSDEIVNLISKELK